MRRILAFACLISAWSAISAQETRSGITQPEPLLLYMLDLVIGNARIIDGTGSVFEQGAIVVRDGTIAAISTNVADAEAPIYIDAAGMTVLPGFIDTHRHLLPSQFINSDEALARWLDEGLPAELQNYLAAGLTTIMSTGDYFPAILEVRQRIEDGELQGPRLISSGSNFSAPEGHPSVSVFGRNPWGGAHHTNAVADPEAARATVRELSDAGVDAIKVIYDGGQDDVWPRLDETVLAAIADEARAHSLPTMVHVHGVEELVTAVELGATRFVHMPYRGSIADAQAARLLREASIPIATTVGIRAPITDAAGGIGRTPGAGRVEFTPLRQMYLTQMLDNLRTLWDAGVIVAFGTDTASLRPAAAIAHEIRTLNEVLTAAEIITALTKNAAQFLGRSEDIGTLEPGKFADIVIIDGDPLTDISSLANVVLVIKGGKIVVDNR